MKGLTEENILLINEQFSPECGEHNAMRTPEEQENALRGSPKYWDLSGRR